MINNNKVYETIDIEGLSTSLAEETWKAETKSVTDDDLYETIAHIDGSIERIVRREWAGAFFNLKEAYIHLIAQYKMPNKDVSREEEGKS